MQQEYKQNIVTLHKIVVYPTNGPRTYRKEFTVQPKGTRFKKGERNKAENDVRYDSHKFLDEMRTQQNNKALYNWQLKVIIANRTIHHQQIKN